MAKTFKQRILVTLEDKATKGAKKVESSMKKMGKSIAAAGAAYFTAQGIIAGMKKSLELAGQAEALSRPFDRLNEAMGGSSQALKTYRSAVNDTINDVDLMRMANSAMTLGVADSEEGMGELLDVAQRLGKSLGVDTRQAVDSLVTGMGRQSILMLDNLGIIVDTNKANEDYAKSIDKTVQELTDQERKIAFNNAALGAAKEKVAILGDEQLTASDKFAQLGTAVDDLFQGIGEGLMPVMEDAAELAIELIESFTGWLETMGFIPTEIDKINQEMDREIFLVNDLFGKLKNVNTTENERHAIYKKLNNIYPDLNLNLSEETRLKGELGDKQKILVRELKEERALKIQEAATSNLNDELDKLRGTYAELRSKYIVLFESMKELPSVQEALNKSLKKAQEDGRDATSVYDLYDEELIDLAKTIDKVTRHNDNLTRVLGRVIGPTMLVQDAWNSIKGVFVDTGKEQMTVSERSNAMMLALGFNYDQLAREWEDDSSDMREALEQIIVKETELQVAIKQTKKLRGTFDEGQEGDGDDGNKAVENSKKEKGAKAEILVIIEQLFEQEERRKKVLEELNKVKLGELDIDKIIAEMDRESEGSIRRRTQAEMRLFAQQIEAQIEEEEHEDEILRKVAKIEAAQHRDFVNKDIINSKLQVENDLLDRKNEKTDQHFKMMTDMRDKMNEDPIVIVDFVEIDGATQAWINYINAMADAKNVTGKFKAETGLLIDHLKLQFKVTRELNKEIVSSAMATGAAQKNLGQAAAQAAVQFVLAQIQKAIAAFIADSFAKFGIFGGIGAAAAGGVVGSVFSQANKEVTEVFNPVEAADGFDGVVTEPTLFLAGEAGPEYVDIEPTTNEGTGRGGNINLTFTGNVLSKDFIQDEALPLIKDALRKGYSI